MKSDKNMISLVEDYLVCRRKLGFALKIEGQELLRFAKFADQMNHQGPVTTELAIQWAKLPQNADPIYWARRLDMVRRFAKHRALFDPDTQIPPQGILGPSYRRMPPYIYSDEEIATLLLAASKLGPVNGLRPHTYVTLFGLLACTGLRISEALRLTQNDINWKDGILTVRASKFKKSRLVPLHHSTVEALSFYCERSNKYHPSVNSAAVFLTEHATPLKYWRTLMTFISLREQLVWNRKGRQRPPRIHDFRHTFAVRKILCWYKQGANIDHKIAALATYMGHVKVTDTYWYITAVPELMAVAASRFENFAD